MLLKDFAWEHVITLQTTYKGRDADSEGWEHFKWECVLLRNGYPGYTLTYKMGVAHQGRKLVVRPDEWVMATYEQIRKVEQAIKYGERSLSPYKPIPPALPDVLSSLQSDCYAIRNSPLWPDFANTNGYDVDSRKAHKVYKACRKAYLSLGKFFRGKFNAFLDCEPE